LGEKLAVLYPAGSSLAENDTDFTEAPELGDSIFEMIFGGDDSGVFLLL
jgi:hypothetical protein